MITEAAAQALANAQNLLQEYVNVLKDSNRLASASLITQAAQQSLQTLKAELERLVEPPKPE